MPESARICDKPAFLKASDVVDSVYSLEPDNKASSRPPPWPHLYISLLK